MNINCVGVILQQIVKGLLHMKEFHIAHNDIKCENILIELNTSRKAIVIKICDLGICSFTDPGEKLSRTFCGTPGFFAPEVLVESAFDPYKSDVFSIACVCLEMLISPKEFASKWLTAYTPENIMNQNHFKDSILVCIDNAKCCFLEKLPIFDGSDISPGGTCNSVYIMQSAIAYQPHKRVGMDEIARSNLCSGSSMTEAYYHLLPNFPSASSDSDIKKENITDSLLTMFDEHDSSGSPRSVNGSVNVSVNMYDVVGVSMCM